MSHQVDDPMLLISQYYPCIYTQVVSEQGEKTKARRRRKKNKSEASNSGVIKKRKLTEEQVNLLEQSFGDEHKLETERKEKLAFELGLNPQQVAVWFQNKRARWKNKKLEEEYSKLKTLHENAVVEKCHLETEILKMKEQLSEAEKEIQRLLLERCDGVSSNSPISVSSFSMEPPLLGQFGMEGILDNLLFMGENINNYSNQGLEWVNPIYM